MSSAKTIRGIGLLVGMMIGAGMFALPYAVVRAGIGWSAFHFIVAIALVSSVHLLYGKVLFEKKSHHRLPGYVRIYIGERMYWVTLISRLFSYFGYLLAYGVLAGLLLNHFFIQVSPAILSGIFFIFAVPFLFLKLSRVGSLNVLLNIALIFFVGVLAYLCLPRFQSGTLQFSGDSHSWFFPYGIFLFAFSGASIIPELVDLFGRGGQRRFRRAVIVGTIIVALVYVVFMFSVLGIARNTISEDGLSSIKEFGGDALFLLGSIIGILAITDSYIDLGLELRFTLEYDLGIKKKIAGAVVSILPLVLYFLGANNFIFILALTGAVGVSVEGISIAMLARKTIGTNLFFVSMLSVAFLVGAVLGILQVL